MAEPQGLMNKFLDIIKEKVSKKQIICVITLFLLALCPEAPKEYVAAVGGAGMIIQGLLDYFRPNGKKDLQNPPE